VLAAHAGDPLAAPATRIHLLGSGAACVDTTRFTLASIRVGPISIVEVAPDGSHRCSAVRACRR
jgi:hypothetical protein